MEEDENQQKIVSHVGHKKKETCNLEILTCSMIELNLIIIRYLQMMIAYASLFGSFVVERVGQRAGLCCLTVLLLVALLGTAYERSVCSYFFY